MRSGTLVVPGIWQRPEPCRGEHGVTEHLQHHGGQNRAAPQPQSEEGGGLRVAYEQRPLASRQVNAPWEQLPLSPQPSLSMSAPLEVALKRC